MSVAAAPAVSARDWLKALTDKAPRFWLGLFTVIVCVHLYITPHADALLRWAAIICFVSGLAMAERLLGRALQIAGAIIVVGLLLVDWMLFANHGFLIAYFAVFFAACAITRADFWKQAVWFTRAMMALVMGAALCHKLVSPYFMNGNLLGEMLLSGQFYTRILNQLYGGTIDIVERTREAQAQIHTNYDIQSTIGAVDLPEIGLFLLVVIYAMTMVSVVVQGLLEAALIWRRSFGIWLHRLIFGFSVMVYSLTAENVFLSMNLMMGYALTDEHSRSMRLPYVIFIAYLLISRVLLYRPVFLH
ncbi:MAG: hypothetical protein AAGD13_14725 [Pseudomonadota bacterium]